MTEKKVSLDAIKQLRERTGVGLSDARSALEETGGDIDLAQDLLRKKGVAKAAKKSDRVAREGLVATYSHGSKVGVLVEVNCETDFVAKTDDFKNLVREIALQVAGASPQYVSRQQVPADVVAHEESIAREQFSGQNKPAEVVEKIIQGKLEKFYESVCLLDQPYIRDPDIRVGQLVTDAVAKLGENIVVARFTRFQLGESR